jgi:lauroyl/myristoyl acyltransferase
MWKYIALLVVYKTLAWLPVRPAYAIARAVADLSYPFQGRTGRNVKDNMRHVLGPGADEKEVSRAAREVFRNITRYYADLIRLPRIDVHHLLEQDLNVHGLENLKNALAQGKGVVLVSAHYGNPELTVQALAAVDIYAYVLTEPLHPRQLSDLTHRLRSTHGHIYQPVGMSSVKGALRYLRQGKMVAILCDRDIQKTGQLLPLCGCPARFPVGAAMLAVRTGAQVVGGPHPRPRAGPHHLGVRPQRGLDRAAAAPGAHRRRGARRARHHGEDPGPLRGVSAPGPRPVDGPRARLGARVRQWLRGAPAGHPPCPACSTMRTPGRS